VLNVASAAEQMLGFYRFKDMTQSEDRELIALILASHLAGSDRRLQAVATESCISLKF
jgi:hypothetical protein